MFCTKCGTMMVKGERFCPVCGNLAEDTAQDEYNGYEYSASKSKSGRKKSNKAGRNIFLIMLAALAMLGIMFALSDTVAGCVKCSSAPDAAVSESDAPADDWVSQSDSAEVIIDDTETSTTTMATTTKITTTATTANAKAQEAERIRKLLLKGSWNTTLEGYDANVTFKSDGSAVIKVKVLFTSVKVNAQYRITDDCKAVIRGEYNGMNLGVSGTISAKSDKEIVVDRGNGKPKVVLKAA